MNNIDLEKYFVRTDLAFEAIDSIDISDLKDIIDEEYVEGNVKVRRIIVNENTSKKINKKAGIYYTLDTTGLKTHDHDELMLCENILSKVIKEILKIEGIHSKSKCLVVGLGNINVTPDSLGPLVIDNVIVTRHMFLIDPEGVSEGISDVSAIAPGVMGTTGIETFDIIDAVIKKIDVDYVIVVDALASKSIARVNKTIQVTNTGISPGSGVGNRRKELSKETIFKPVIAIGVPTVVDAVTIASDTIDIILKYFGEKISSKNLLKKDKQIIFGEVGLLDEEEKRSLFDQILTPSGFNMMVTPKEVDLDIEDLTNVISGAIDRALHTIVDVGA